jgi:two-component system NtrC family response regulator
MAQTILIVDDDAAIRLLLRSHLESKGYACATANDGAEALALLGKRQYHLLITDLDMPGMGGVELLQEVRSRGLITRCIVVTGYATIGNLTACLREGAVALVPKPLRDFELLDQAVALAFEQTRLWAVQMKAIVQMKTAASALELRGSDAR